MNRAAGGAELTREMGRRYTSGETIAVIAASTGLDVATVHRRLKGAGVAMRPAARKPQRSAEILARAAGGQDGARIAAEMGITPDRVRVVLKAARQGGRPRTVLPLAVISRRYRAGESIKDLAAGYGSTRETIRRRLADAGVPIRGREAGMAARRARGPAPLRKDLPAQEIAARYQSGESLAALASAYGTSAASIRRRVLREGTQLRDRSQAVRLASRKIPRAPRIRRNGTPRRLLILRALTEHPEGLTTSQLAVVLGEPGGQRTQAMYGEILRPARDAGHVVVAGRTPAGFRQPGAHVWQVTPAGRDAAWPDPRQSSRSEDPAASARLGRDLLRLVDERAAAGGVSRSEMIRELLSSAIGADSGCG